MHDQDETSNPRQSGSFTDVARVDGTRRRMLYGGVGAAVTSFLPWSVTAWSRVAGAAPPAIGFRGVPVSRDDAVHVPEGYVAQVLFAWGDPVSDGPAFHPDASNSAAEQELQAGMHHDGMHYFPLPGRDPNAHGLLALNHEYADDGLLHPDGMGDWTAEKVRKSQAAHGVSVIEVRRGPGGSWEVVRPSPYARRITARTPMRLSGPAAGHPWLRTAADPHGTTVLGTLNNCGCGFTPWGTYLTCEENFHFYFRQAGEPGSAQRRYGLGARGGYRWEEFDERFDADRHPNEPNRFGWVVEIDPYDRTAVPVKRTALGRFSHEVAAHTLAPDGRVVVYSGDDQRNEYIYKFVSRDRWDPARPAAARDLLDHGTLYVARFQAGGRGQWLELTHGINGLTRENGFASQAEVLIHARMAADRVGATMMDRPEWLAVPAERGEVYCALTNNNRRGGQPASSNRTDGSTRLASASPAVDPANPRADNVFGHIVRWREAGGDAGSSSFEWEVFVLCGDPAHPDAARRGNVQGDAFGSPDGLWIDPHGRLWIQTDVSQRALNRGDYANLGNNQMLCADPATGVVRRFLTGPRGCEMTGATGTPDGRTLFVNVQHPGETPGERSDPQRPAAFSSWPDGGRPRSATLAVFRGDGGPVGT